jgi:hypothetical protein
LNCGITKEDKKEMVAFEGEFDKSQPSHGTVYFSDGTEESI